ncbi:MAG: hypothetical protein ABJB05_00090 [Parafilimonas sp.]
MQKIAGEKEIHKGPCGGKDEKVRSHKAESSAKPCDVKKSNNYDFFDSKLTERNKRV